MERVGTLGRLGIDETAVERSLHAVLEPTERGREELRQPRLGLSLSQRKLLLLLDGTRTLRAIADGEPALNAERVVGGAMRLDVLGLTAVRTGQLPAVGHGWSEPARSDAIGAAPPEPTTSRDARRVDAGTGRNADRSPSLRRGVGILVSLAFGAVVAGLLVMRPWSGDAAPEAASTPVPPHGKASAALRVPAAVPPAVVAAPTEVQPVAAPAAATRSPVEPSVASIPGPREVAREPVSAVTAAAPGTERAGARTRTPSPPAVASRPESARSAGAVPRAVPADPRPASALRSITGAAATTDELSPAAPSLGLPPPTVSTPPAVPARADADKGPGPAASGVASPVAPVVGGAVAARPPPLQPLQRVLPDFPPEAYREGLEGATLRARLHVAPDGGVQRVEISGTTLRERMFERSARDALARWRFPAGSGDRVYDTEVVFRLE